MFQENMNLCRLSWLVVIYNFADTSFMVKPAGFIKLEVVIFSFNSSKISFNKIILL